MLVLLEFQQLEERDARLAERVTHVIGHLLRHQFLHIDAKVSAGTQAETEVPRRGGLRTLCASRASRARQHFRNRLAAAFRKKALNADVRRCTQNT
jgi:hypothetical protein